MNNYKNKSTSIRSLSKKIKEAEKMIKIGCPFGIVCKTLDIPAKYIEYLKSGH